MMEWQDGIMFSWLYVRELLSTPVHITNHDIHTYMACGVHKYNVMAFRRNHPLYRWSLSRRTLLIDTIRSPEMFIYPIINKKANKGFSLSSGNPSNLATRGEISNERIKAHAVIVDTYAILISEVSATDIIRLHEMDCRL